MILGAAERREGKVPVSFPTWCLTAPVQKVLSGPSLGVLPFRKYPVENSYPSGYAGSFTSLSLGVQTCSQSLPPRKEYLVRGCEPWQLGGEAKENVKIIQSSEGRLD